MENNVKKKERKLRNYTNQKKRSNDKKIKLIFFGNLFFLKFISKFFLFFFGKTLVNSPKIEKSSKTQKNKKSNYSENYP